MAPIDLPLGRQPTVGLASTDPDETIRPVTHTGRHVAAGLVAIVAILVVVSLAKNRHVGWHVIGTYLFRSVTLGGVAVTLELTAAAMAIGVVGGVIVAIMRMSESYVLRTIATGYVTIFRSAPVLVQILFWGYLGVLYPKLMIGVPFTNLHLIDVQTSSVVGAYVAALLALGLNEVAYAAEIVRGGLQAIPAGQREAAHSLGLSPRATMRRIVLPQAMRVIVPPMGNEVITMLKTTALVSVIGGEDLLTRMENIYAQTYQVIPLLLVASIWYLALTAALTLLQSRLERRYGKAFAPGRRGVPRVFAETVQPAVDLTRR
jgi:polar amino acid transport system permease protein